MAGTKISQHMVTKPCFDRIRVEQDGTWIADTVRAIVLHEGTLPPVYYIPIEDGREAYLKKTETQTHCPFKGDACYWTVKVGEHVAENAAWSYPVTLLPMIPLAFVLVAWLRFFRRMDELQQRMQMEALAFAFGGTALITFSYGFLQSAGFPDLSWFFVWSLMTALWILGGLIARRRWL